MPQVQIAFSPFPPPLSRIYSLAFGGADAVIISISQDAVPIILGTTFCYLVDILHKVPNVKQLPHCDTTRRLPDRCRRSGRTSEEGESAKSGRKETPRAEEIERKSRGRRDRETGTDS